VHICVEVDLEKGLPEAINLTLDNWNYLQQVDYEQLPFKCKICHEYGHFVKHCPKSPPESPIEESEQWQQPKRRKQQKHGPNPKAIPTPPPPNISPDPGSVVPNSTQEPTREEPPPQQPQIAPLPPSPQTLPPESPIPPSAPPSPSHPASLPEDEDPEQSSEEESDSDAHASPIRKVGRKSNLHKREASARKEIELGKQTTLDQLTRKEARQTRNQSGSNPHKGGNPKPSK
jgi:hypothetical protein